jgi:hypothetical protein
MGLTVVADWGLRLVLSTRNPLFSGSRPTVGISVSQSLEITSLGKYARRIMPAR